MGVELVVCINNKEIPGCGNRYLNLIEEGRIYTIKRIFEGFNFLTLKKELSYTLEGVDVPIDGDFVGYFSGRFRPTKPTSIDVFHEILKKINTRPKKRKRVLAN